MQGKANQAQPQKLDEFALRDELKRLRAQIPDNPSLNPILNVAFDLSRRLETGTIAYEELKSLAGRIMDRACVHRARRLRERIGYVDQAATLKDFTSYVERIADQSGSLEAFASRWQRARTGIVLTAHPTFGLSDALYKRMVEIAVADPSSKDVTIGMPHRPAPGISLVHEHKCAQDAINNLRNAYEDLLHGFYSVAAQKFGAKAYALRPKADDFCLVGRLRSRRTHRYRLDVFVQGSPAREAFGTCRYPRAISYFEAQAWRRRRRSAHCAPTDSQTRSRNSRCR